MRNAVIENGVVTNIIEGTVPGLVLVPDDGTASIGDTWDGQQFVKPPDPAPTVPDVISPRQFRHSLTHFGFRAQVDQAVAASDQDTKDWYEFATQFERQHPVVVSMAQAMGFTPAQMDQVWTYGASL